MRTHYCDAVCIHNDNPEQICKAVIAGHVNRNCVTFRKRPREPNYYELMKSNVGLCERQHGAMKRKGR